MGGQVARLRGRGAVPRETVAGAGTRLRSTEVVSQRWRPGPTPSSVATFVSRTAPARVGRPAVPARLSARGCGGRLRTGRSDRRGTAGAGGSTRGHATLRRQDGAAARGRFGGPIREPRKGAGRAFHVKRCMPLLAAAGSADPCLRPGDRSAPARFARALGLVGDGRVVATESRRAGGRRTTPSDVAPAAGVAAVSRGTPAVRTVGEWWTAHEGRTTRWPGATRAAPGTVT